MKRRFLFALVANLAIFVALLGVRPTSWLAWYQPEAPREISSCKNRILSQYFLIISHKWIRLGKVVVK
ncbi:hypothetical protein MHOCP_06610 [Moorella humiferrea]|uniref:cyclic lactone autoinducer peptide n=1 Tax=Neomoorella humiferrea TaxID=676965 RepID=UPI0030CC5812